MSTGLPLSGHAIAELVHQSELLPLLAVLVVRPKAWAFWWVAFAFTVSYVADYGTHVGISPFVVSRTYPVLQAICLGVAFLGVAAAERWAVFLFLVAFVLSLVWRSDTLMLRAFCWLGACAIALEEAPRDLRRAIVVSFGLGWLAWAVDTNWRVAAAWYAYHGVWVLGELFFIGAVWRGRKGVLYA